MSAKRSIIRDGAINLAVTDPKWLASKLSATGAYQTWFLFKRTTILGGADGIEAFLNPDNIERASDDSAYDQFLPPWGGPNGPTSFLKIASASDCAIPFYLNAPVPRILTILDNRSQATRKRGYMRAITTECIESIFYPALVAALESHLPKWAAHAELGLVQDAELRMTDAIGELVWDAIVVYIYGELPPADESAAMRIATDALLSSLGKSPIFSAGWRAAAAATSMHLRKLRAQLSTLRAEQAAGTPPRKARTLLEALAFDTSPHRLADEEIVYETFHSIFVSLGGFRCWIVNYLMELLLHPQEMALAVAEVTAAPPGHCCTDFAFLQDGCPRATMGIHETKRMHTCLTNTLFGRARRAFTALGVHVAKGEQVLAALGFTNRDPTIWGDDAQEWRPERMAHNGGASTHENGPHSGPWEGKLKFGFCAHGAGDRDGPCSRRRCPGEELSTLAIKLISLEVIRCYELQLIEGQDLSECHDTALPVPTSGLRVRVRRRGETVDLGE